jgi:hypothetical protein
MGRSYSATGEKVNAHKSELGKLGRKRPLGIPRRRWVDIIKMDLKMVMIGLD